MRASKADKFYMGMLLAIICFCFGLLRIMDEEDARRAAERETLIIAEPPTIVAPFSRSRRSTLSRTRSRRNRRRRCSCSERMCP